jgi:hypothetical protein
MIDIRFKFKIFALMSVVLVLKEKCTEFELCYCHSLSIFIMNISCIRFHLFIKCHV